jgi:hypothetical protein
MAMKVEMSPGLKPLNVSMLVCSSLYRLLSEVVSGEGVGGALVHHRVGLAGHVPLAENDESSLWYKKE